MLFRKFVKATLRDLVSFKVAFTDIRRKLAGRANLQLMSRGRRMQ